MASRRCSTCGINYPTTQMKCPVCDENTWWSQSNDPDEDWQESVSRLHAVRSGDEGPLIPHVSVPVKVRDDQLWLDAWDLWHDPARLYRLQPGDLVQIGQQVFEIQGYRKESHSYWVRTFDPCPTLEEVDAVVPQWIDESTRIPDPPAGAD